MRPKDSKHSPVLVTSFRPTFYKALFAVALALLVITFLMVWCEIIHTDLIGETYRTLVYRVNKASNQTTKRTVLGMYWLCAICHF